MRSECDFQAPKSDTLGSPAHSMFLMNYPRTLGHPCLQRKNAASLRNFVRLLPFQSAILEDGKLHVKAEVFLRLLFLAFMLGSQDPAKI